MIDFEATLYDGLVTAVETAYPGISCSSVEQNTPPSFPSFAFLMVNNPINRRTYDGTGENFCNPKFKTVAYVADNNRLLAKSILDVADQYLMSKGILRTIGPQQSGSADANYYTLYNIYDANTIDSNGTVYTR